MSQSYSPQTISALEQENRRLESRLEELEDRLALYEDECEDDGSQWNVAPYSWAIAATRFSVERFHSLHGKLCDGVLTWRNRRALRAYQRYQAAAQYESRDLRLL